MIYLSHSIIVFYDYPHLVGNSNDKETVFIVINSCQVIVKTITENECAFKREN